MTIRMVDEFVYMVPLNETRICAAPRCDEYTWWAKPKQRAHGTCGDHFPGAWTTIPTPALFARVLDNLLRTFPGASISDYAPTRYEPGTYVGPDAGPCVRCRRAVRRYGPFAEPRCADCHRRREESTR